MMRRRYGGYIGFFIFMFISLNLTACNKQVHPNVYEGLKPSISEAAKIDNAKGLAFAKEGKYREAIAAYKDAISKEPAFADAYVNCSKAYYVIGDRVMANFYKIRADELIDPQIGEIEVDQKK